MKARSAIALCAAGLLVGAAAGFFLARGNLDAELRQALAEKDRLMAELRAAAEAVKESGSNLDSIREKMTEATEAADRAAADISGKATTIEALALRMKSYVRDARERLAALSEEMKKAVAASKERQERIEGAIEKARGHD